MGLLMLRCPMTDRNFSTGIHTDKDSIKLMPNTEIAARCPYCGREHTGTPREGWVAESVPLSEQIVGTR